jgi:hypothetical protein
MIISDHESIHDVGLRRTARHCIQVCTPPRPGTDSELRGTDCRFRLGRPTESVTSNPLHTAAPVRIMIPPPRPRRGPGR